MNTSRDYAIPSFQNRRLRRDYVLATKVNRDEWHAIKELAEKRRRTISDLIRFLLVEETQKTAQYLFTRNIYQNAFMRSDKHKNY